MLAAESTASAVSPFSRRRLLSLATASAAQPQSAPKFDWYENAQPFRPPEDLKRVTAPPDAHPVVILPGFGNKTEDYTAPFGDADAALASVLERRGFRSYTVPVLRKDWLNVARGVLRPAFWRGECTTHPSYSWYLARVRACVQQALAETGATQVTLVGHSAGGWLARAFVGDPQWFLGEEGTGEEGRASASPNPAVAAVVTLGTPQCASPSETGADRSGGALTWVAREFPGAYFRDQGVQYVTVCGETVTGRKRDKTAQDKATPTNYAFNSYKEVCGEGEGVVGDGIVPLRSALLDGAHQVVIKGVFHSMSRLGTFEDASGDVWYGSETVADTWLASLVHSPASAMPVS